MEELIGNKFPLIGDQLPEMEVQTTHGKMKLPDNFSGKWLITQIKHNVNSTLEYKQNLRLWKNSFANNGKV